MENYDKGLTKKYLINFCFIILLVFGLLVVLKYSMKQITKFLGIDGYKKELREINKSNKILVNDVRELNKKIIFTDSLIRENNKQKRDLTTIINNFNKENNESSKEIYNYTIDQHVFYMDSIVGANKERISKSYN